MSKLMDKLSDKLSNLGKSDKSGQDEPVKAGEAGKMAEEPRATQIEDTGKSAPPDEPQSAQADTAKSAEPAPASQGTESSTLTEPIQERSDVTASSAEPEQTATPAAAGLAQQPEPELLRSAAADESAQAAESGQQSAKPTESAPQSDPAPTEAAPQAESAPAEATTRPESAPTDAAPQPESATPAAAGLAQQPEPELLRSSAADESAPSAEAGQPQAGAMEESEKPTEAAASSEEGPVFVGSIDQGTTSTRFLIFDKAGEPVAVHQEEFQQIYPNPGWHEHDPEEIVKSVENCIEGAIKNFEADGHSRNNIKTVGITNQRETTVCWDWTTGKALYNAIVWTDTRTAAIARELKARDGSEKQEVCGLPISSYPSVTKLLWMLKNVAAVKEAFDAGNLAFGTIDAWLIYNLNGGQENPVFVSDPTNASRTMFMDIHTLKYSDEMLDFFSYEFDLRKVHMPEIVRSSDKECFGKLSSGPLKGWSITGCLGDQSSALVGQKGFDPGSAKNTYGTGCFLLYNVGEKPVISKHGLLATVAYDFDGKPVYALEGSIAVAGSGVKFLMENLGFDTKSSRITELAESVDDNGGLVFVTAFSGLFAPYWIDSAQGTMFGITGHTKRGHVARATLEAVCFQTKAILDAMELDSGHRLTELKVDGGMSNSALCMQTQADLTQIPIIRPKMRETTALGAAIAAGFASGVWKNFDELKEVNTAGQTTFDAKMADKDSKKMFKKWERAVSMCKGWVEETEAVDQEKDTEESSKL